MVTQHFYVRPGDDYYILISYGRMYIGDGDIEVSCCHIELMTLYNFDTLGICDIHRPQRIGGHYVLIMR